MLEILLSIDDSLLSIQNIECSSNNDTSYKDLMVRYLVTLIQSVGLLILIVYIHLH